MAEPIRMRVREGCRGGHEQFRWDSVKDQDFKDREQYLGQSTKVGMMGKFGRYYQHDWYAKKRDTPESIEAEKGNVKAFEEELMQEALGLKPKKLLLQKRALSEEELKDYLCKERPEGRRGRDSLGPQKHIEKNEFGESITSGDFIGDAHRDALIKGVGFAHHRTVKLEEYKAKILGTEGKLEGAKEEDRGLLQAAVKLEDGDTDVIRFGPAQAKAELEAAKAEAAKAEAVKEEPAAAEVKTEPSEVESQRGTKRGVEDERSQRKAEKKEKKLKKVAKKQKKREKKAKKAAKEAKKLAKKVEKTKRRGSSWSGSSSDSASS